MLSTVLELLGILLVVAGVGVVFGVGFALIAGGLGVVLVGYLTGKS